MQTSRFLNHDRPTATKTAGAEKPPVLLLEQMQAAENLVDELKQLLEKYEPVIDREGARSQMETLEYWAECYRYGLSAADKIFQNGNTWLSDLNERLKQETESMRRLEDEGGQPVEKSQASCVDNFAKTTHYLSRVIRDIERLFGHAGLLDANPKSDLH